MHTLTAFFTVIAFIHPITVVIPLGDPRPLSSSALSIYILIVNVDDIGALTGAFRPYLRYKSR